jgi:predicted ABC-type ATPase
MRARPTLVVLAGPNGSGKSTLTNYLLGAGVDFGTYINPDEIAATLDLGEPERSRAAQAIADSQRDACLQSRRSFAFETVMSHPSKIDLMQRAANAGYDVTLYFVCTSDPTLNLKRIAQRVVFGGHDVPEDRVVSRYARTLDLLVPAALIAHRTVLFDNSRFVPPSVATAAKPGLGLRPVAELTRDPNGYRLKVPGAAPRWVRRHFIDPLNARAAELTLTSTRDSDLTSSPRPPRPSGRW